MKHNFEIIGAVSLPDMDAYTVDNMNVMVKYHQILGNAGGWYDWSTVVEHPDRTVAYYVRGGYDTVSGAIDQMREWYDDDPSDPEVYGARELTWFEKWSDA